MRRYAALPAITAFTILFFWTVVTYGSGPGWHVWPWWDQAALGGLFVLFLILRAYSKGARYRG